MTDRLSSTQSWAKLANGAALGGSGIFGFTGAHRQKGTSGQQAAATADSVSDSRLSFNRLFANDLSQNALSATDPSAQDAATQQAAAADGAVAGTDSTSAGDATPTTAGPLSPGLLAFLMDLTGQAAATTPADAGAAATDVTTATAADDGAAAVQAPAAAGTEAGPDALSDAFAEILSELSEPAGTSPADQAPSGTASLAATDDPSADDPSAGNGAGAVADAVETDPAGSPAALQATALLEMQKALGAYFSGSLTGSTATAAATSIAI